MPFSEVRRGLIPVTLFLSFTFISNLFYQSGKVMAVLGPLSVTDEGFRIASLRSLRVFDLVYAAKILAHVTTLEAMIGSLRKLLRPLERIGLPVHYFFSVTVLTLQCFPVIKQKIYDKYTEEMKQRSGAATCSRGIKNILPGARLIASFMIPLFVESMADPDKFFKDVKGE